MHPAQTGGGAAGDVFLRFLRVGLVCVFFVHHVTWSINRDCRFRGDDEKRNNPIYGVLGLG